MRDHMERDSEDERPPSPRARTTQPLNTEGCPDLGAHRRRSDGKEREEEDRLAYNLVNYFFLSGITTF